MKKLIIAGDSGIGDDNIGLLEISRVVRTEMKFDAVKVSELVNGIAQLLGGGQIRYDYLRTGVVCKFGNINPAAKVAQAHYQNSLAGKFILVVLHLVQLTIERQVSR